MCQMVRRPPGIELALLGFLQAGPQHGYQIHRMVSDSDGLGSIWRLKQSQLYALLAKLEMNGFIRGELELQEEARPPRRMYQLTTDGQAVFQDWLKRPVNVPRLMRQEFIAKYYFSCQEGKEQARELIDLQRAACQGWLEKLEPTNREPTSFNWLIYQYRVGQIKAILAWLDTCQHEFEW
jgi:DNA-binding PadR family transcriptional regulator